MPYIILFIVYMDTDGFDRADKAGFDYSRCINDGHLLIWGLVTALVNYAWQPIN